MLGETLGLIDIEGLKDGDTDLLGDMLRLGDGLGYDEYPLMLGDTERLGLLDGETLGLIDIEGLTLGLLLGEGLKDALLLGDGLGDLIAEGMTTQLE